MESSLYVIKLPRLMLVFLPLCAVIAVFLKWKIEVKMTIHALFRMLFQLLLVGYFLAYIFQADRAMIIVAVISVMLGTSSWIALRTIKHFRKKLYFLALGSIALGGISTLVIVIKGVLKDFIQSLQKTHLLKKPKKRHLKLL